LNVPAVDLVEWQTATPESTPTLAGVRVPDSGDVRAVIAHVSQRQMLDVRELVAGLEIRTTSYVGSLDLGPVMLRIRPKLEADAFAALVGYALGLPQIELLPQHTARLSAAAFQDLLIARLADEASRLLARGTYRQYGRQDGFLESPRGRVLFDRLARTPRATATVPCAYHERDEDVLPNRVLLAGLRLAAALATSTAMRQRAQRPLLALADRVQPVTLNASTMRDLDRIKSRLLGAYEPAFAVIRLLMSGHGISTSDSSASLQLPGFLFNMNVLFQQALGRLFRESLDDVVVHEQYSVTDMFEYQPLFNPRRKRAPTPRPDYVFVRRGVVVGIADAKYRDLWEHDLGRDMLYQLSIYALSNSNCRVSTIFYPASDRAAREARIAINDPTSGHTRGYVHLRPVSVSYLSELVQSRTAEGLRRRRAFAEYLAFATTDGS
jgi:5-methylcytosine-specific restriction enzyme subunit McrC